MSDYEGLVKELTQQVVQEIQEAIVKKEVAVA